MPEPILNKQNIETLRTRLQRIEIDCASPQESEHAKFPENPIDQRAQMFVAKLLGKLMHEAYVQLEEYQVLSLPQLTEVFNEATDKILQEYAATTSEEAQQRHEDMIMASNMGKDIETVGGRMPDVAMSAVDVSMKLTMRNTLGQFQAFCRDLCDSHRR